MARQPKPKARERKHSVKYNWGYETDGIDWWLAPAAVSRMDAALEDEAGLRSFIAALNEDLIKRTRVVEKAKGDWWKEVMEEHEIPVRDDGSYEYRQRERQVRFVPKATEASA